MKLYELSPTPGSKTVSKRIGRGPGSGTGKTSGKGHKGQNARSGGGVPAWFEGGQMRITQRLRKRGFTNKFAKSYVSVNVERLDKLEAGSVVNAQFLKDNGIIAKIEDGVVILGKGELTKKLTVQAKRFSETAKEKILSAGGKVEVV